MKSLIRIAFILGILLPLSTYTQQRQLVQEDSRTEKRIALVIGNSAYLNAAPLKNPVNDAQDMAQVLRELGFDVIYRANLNQNDMKRAIREFGVKIRNGGVGLFYYAGHGVAVKGINYLVPVSAKVESEDEVEYECVDAGFVLAQMDNAGNRLNIVVLDACRNNPFARSFRSASRGLAQMDAPSGTLIAYATAPGSVASDGNARNGFYTQELLKFLRAPKLGIEEVFKQVRISVRNLTQGRQTPWESSSLTGDFYFTRAGIAGSVPSNLPDANATEVPDGTKSELNSLLIPFARVMNEAFAKEYVGKSIRTRVHFIAAGQTQGWLFGAIPRAVMEGKVAFRVSEFESVSNSEIPFGSVPPHVFIDKDNADLIFELKKGDRIILTGAPVVGTNRSANYTQVVFVATSIERAN